jgi:hypothetical protein
MLRSSFVPINFLHSVIDSSVLQKHSQAELNGLAKETFSCRFEEVGP